MRKLMWTTAATALLFATGGPSKAAGIDFNYNLQIDDAVQAMAYDDQGIISPEEVRIKGGFSNRGKANVQSDLITVTLQFDHLGNINFQTLCHGVPTSWDTKDLSVRDQFGEEVTSLTAQFGRTANGGDIWNLVASDFAGDLSYGYTSAGNDERVKRLTSLQQQYGEDILVNEGKINELKKSEGVAQYYKGQDILSRINEVSSWTPNLLADFNKELASAGYKETIALNPDGTLNLGKFPEELKAVHDQNVDKILEINKLTALNVTLNGWLAQTDADILAYGNLTYANGIGFERLTALGLTSGFLDVGKMSLGLSFSYGKIDRATSLVFLQDIRDKLCPEIVKFNPGSVTTVVAVTPVPEPTTLALVGVGALGMIARRRKTRK